MHQWKVYAKAEEGWTWLGIAGVVVMARSWFDEKSMSNDQRRHEG